ncbi:Serine hydroxymethyltransferase [Brevibacterium sp. Mu109]|nr:Serine hydroxymethyltransferase [Brevibacterium sp. Mu109]
MDADPQLHTLVSEEMSRQRQTLEMIASENFAPVSVLQAQGSILTNKYSEGYPALPVSECVDPGR